MPTPSGAASDSERRPSHRDRRARTARIENRCRPLSRRAAAPVGRVPRRGAPPLHSLHARAAVARVPVLARGRACRRPRLRHVVGAELAPLGGARGPPRRLLRAGLHRPAPDRNPARRDDPRPVVLRASGLVPAARGAPAPAADPRGGAGGGPRADGLGVLAERNRNVPRHRTHPPAGDPARYSGADRSPARRRARADGALRRIALQPAAAAGSDRRLCACRTRAFRREARHRRRRSHLPAAGPPRRRGGRGRVGAHRVPALRRRRGASPAVRRSGGVRLPVGIRRLRDDAARGALGRGADRPPRHRGRARDLRTGGHLRGGRRPGGRRRRASDAPGVARRGARDAAPPRRHPRTLLVGSGSPRHARGDRGAGPAMTRLSIVIVSFNASRELDACRRSLGSAPPEAAHEIVVVDNASSDDSVMVARRHLPSGTVLVQPRNTGFAAANNAGIRATSGDLLLLLNSDTVAGRGALDALIGRLLADPAAAVAGPRLVGADGVAELSFGPMMSPMAELRQKLRVTLHERRVGAVSRWVERATRRERYVDWVSGACLLVRRTAAEAVGLLDERFFLYTEDIDFCAAIRAKGHKILFTPAAEVVHLKGRSRSSAPAASRAAYRRSHLAFYEKHHPGWAPLLRAYLRLRGEPIEPKP